MISPIVEITGPIGFLTSYIDKVTFCGSLLRLDLGNTWRCYRLHVYGLPNPLRTVQHVFCSMAKRVRHSATAYGEILRIMLPQLYCPLSRKVDLRSFEWWFLLSTLLVQTRLGQKLYRFKNPKPTSHMDRRPETQTRIARSCTLKLIPTRCEQLKVPYAQTSWNIPKVYLLILWCSVDLRTRVSNHRSQVIRTSPFFSQIPSFSPRNCYSGYKGTTAYGPEWESADCANTIMGNWNLARKRFSNFQTSTTVSIIKDW